MEKHTFSLISGQYRLTSNPCFSDGTHTSLLAAQSAWLAAEKTELEVGEPGLAPDDRKWVTSLVLFPVALDIVLLAKVRKKNGRQKGKTLKMVPVLRHFFFKCRVLGLSGG